MDLEKDMEWLDRRLPRKSIMGGEWFSLRKKHDLEKSAFERSSDKMSYETSEYRRAVRSLISFIEEYLPRIRAYDENIDQRAKDALDYVLEKEARHVGWNRATRQDILSMWTVFILERVRILFPNGTEKLARVNPSLAKRLEDREEAFNNAAYQWLSMQCPWDESRAHNALLDWLVDAHQLAHVNH